jgi:2-dehydropantoate 2-reductase
MRILIIGAGAVGGYFGARLAAAGRDVTFLVRPARAQQLQQGGLQVFSPHGDLKVQPKLLLASVLAENPDPFDLILVSTKAYSLAAAMDDFAPAVGPGTTILPLLNGLAHLDALDARFGAKHVLGGSTRIVADLDTEGRVRQMELLQDISFGERDKRITPRVQAIDVALGDAGFHSVLQPDILAYMWQKWTFLAALGAITCLLRGTIGQVVAAPGGLEIARQAIAETDAIATANGYPTPPPFLENTSSRLLKAGSPLTASMYRDLSKGAPVEADHILGDMLARGRTHGVAAPILQAAYAQLSIYSSARAATANDSSARAATANDFSARAGNANASGIG